MKSCRSSQECEKEPHSWVFSLSDKRGLNPRQLSPKPARLRYGSPNFGPCAGAAVARQELGPEFGVLGHWFRIEVGAKLINQIRRAAFASPPLLWPATAFSRPPRSSARLMNHLALSCGARPRMRIVTSGNYAGLGNT